jgi:biotin operon repressor|tara:strand:- start:800 stop:1021 length:222 start_codon:yes stop_codon:yes gene_type:complete
MGNEQLTDWQAAQLKWLKRQVDNLQDESGREDSRPRIEQELFAAMEELDNYVDALKSMGIAIEHRRRSWQGVV